MKSGLIKACLVLNVVLALGVAFLGGVAVSSFEARAAANDFWSRQDGRPAPIGGAVETMTVPAQKWVAVTPSDSTDLPDTPRAIYSYDGGDVACRDRDGTVILLLLAAGEEKPYRCVRVMDTDTTATSLFALY